MKEFIVKDQATFRVRGTVKDVLMPKELKNIEFHQECKNKNGDVIDTNVYQFFMTQEELNILAKGLQDELV
jgi:hypothetical protein